MTMEVFLELNVSQDVLDSSLWSCFLLLFSFLQAFPTDGWLRRESPSQTAAHPHGLDDSWWELLAQHPENKPHPRSMCVVAFLHPGQEAPGLTVGLGLVPPAFGAVIASRGHAGELARADQQRSAYPWWRNGWWTG